LEDTLDRIVKIYLGSVTVRTLVTAAFLLLLLLWIAVTAYLLISNAGRVVNNVIVDAGKSTNREIIREVTRFLKTADSINRELENAVHAERVDVKDTETLLRHFWDKPQRDSEFSVSAIYYGDESGVFTGLGTEQIGQPPDEWQIGLSSPQTKGLYTLYEANELGTVANQIGKKDPFDPRTRPWYEVARNSEEAQWTEAYSDVQAGSATISRTRAIRDNDNTLLGVAGVDLYLGHIRQFLSTLPISENSEVFMLDEQGQVLASYAPAYSLVATVDQVHAVDSAYRFTRTGALHLQAEHSGFRVDELTAELVELDGVAGFLHASPVARELNLGWSLGIFIPRSDYTESVSSQLKRIVPLGVLASLLACATMIGFLHLISKPLRQLRDGANRLSMGDFDVPIDTSYANEVGDLARAIDTMRHKLRDSFSAMSEQKLRAETTLTSIADGVITISNSGKIKYMNPSAEQQTGWTFDAAKDRPAESVFHAFDLQTQMPLTTSNILQAISNSTHLGQEIMLVDRAGKSHPVYCRTSPVHDDAHQPFGAVLIFSDQSERWALESELMHQASHDSLTDLLNRHEFERRLQHVIDRAHRESSEHAMLYLDLDRFQLVNDTCGHVAGDELLRQTAQLLQRGIRSGDSIARLGGDEFGVLLEYCPGEQAKRVGEQLLKLTGDYRFVWEDRTFGIGVSLGLVPIVKSTANVVAAIRDAENACFVAKQAGRNRMRIFSEDDEQLAQRRGEMQWVDRIDGALERDEFVLFTQSIEPTGTDDAEGIHFEVLIRMLHENGDIIPPGQFLPAAERYDLITRIDRWVISNTLQWLSRHPLLIPAVNLCSINVSGQSLGDSSFLPFIIEQLDTFDVPAECICFEVTETATIANLSSAMVLMNTLKRRGCAFALDDFGSGLSSFAYLKNLPVDFLKIDGMFVKEMLEDPLDLAMVRSINEIGQTMKMQTIAEFVETDELRAQLSAIGVNYVQGYGIGKPQLIDDLVETTAS